MSLYYLVHLVLFVHCPRPGHSGVFDAVHAAGKVLDGTFGLVLHMQSVLIV